MTLITPFVALAEERQVLFDKLRPFAKVMSWIAPNYSFTIKDPHPTWLNHWREDPLEQGHKVNASNLLTAASVSDFLFTEIGPKIKTPLLLILGSKEQVVCNATAKAFFQTLPIADKSMLEFKDADHMIINDKEFASLVIKEAVSWQNMRLL